MERRHFLKLAFGVAAGAAALAATAQAAPLLPRPLAKDERLPPTNQDVHPAVTSDAEIEHLKPEQIHWGHHRHWHHRGWHHRHWGWHHRRWHRWHHRHWHRHHWHHRHW